MWICASEAKIRVILIAILFSMMAVAALFFLVQNSATLAGGSIAFPKLLWLTTVIFCWFIIPILLIVDARFLNLRFLISLFIFNMLFRAIIELVMMFISNNWHPYYGIGHDLFTLLLCSVLAVRIGTKNKLVSGYFRVMAILFLIESLFAWYMLNNVHNETGIVYYVPDEEPHQLVLRITTFVVLATLIYLTYFLRKWLYGTSLKG